MNCFRAGINLTRLKGAIADHDPLPGETWSIPVVQVILSNVECYGRWYSSLGNVYPGGTRQVMSMRELHESFEPLEEPLDEKLGEFLYSYREGAQEGVPVYDHFDYLEWPKLVSWMTVIHYPARFRNRYSAGNARMLFDGARRVSLFEADLAGETLDELDDKSLNRWSSLYGLSLRHKEPTFARSHVFGIDKDHIRFEIGLFPFADMDGSISHILSIVQRVYE